MTEKAGYNNQAIVAGEIVSGFKFSHEMYGETFYMVDVLVNRLSDSYDIIPLMVSDAMLDVRKNYIGKKVEASGQFRSYNQHETTGTRLILSLFVQQLQFIGESDYVEQSNHIYLDGFLCKSPVYRVTPLGREIADLMLAVNRSYGKSDYIPCICWGHQARFAGKLEVGTQIILTGRIQSREYQKRLGNDSIVSKVAYEVSVQELQCYEQFKENMKECVAKSYQ